MKSKDSLYFHASSSPVEVNNSKSVQFVADNLTVESCSLSLSVSVEAKALKTCRSLFEAKYETSEQHTCICTVVIQIIFKINNINIKAF